MIDRPYNSNCFDESKNEHRNFDADEILIAESDKHWITKLGIP